MNAAGVFAFVAFATATPPAIRCLRHNTGTAANTAPVRKPVSWNCRNRGSVGGKDGPTRGLSSLGSCLVFCIFFDTAALLDPHANERRAMTCTRPMSRSGGMVNALHDAGLVHVSQDGLTIRVDYSSFVDF